MAGGFRSRDFWSEHLRQCSPESLQFSVFTTNEIKKLSVVKITTPLSFNAVGHPLPGGLYDPALGPTEFSMICPTCSSKSMKCPGHFGHIELPVSVVNPLYYKVVGNILRISCLFCHTVLLSNAVKTFLVGQINLLQDGYISEAQNMYLEFPVLDTNLTKEDAEQVSAINEHVQQVRAGPPGLSLQFKGEGELRNVFIKFAVSNIYKGRTCPRCGVSRKRITLLQNRILTPVGKVDVAEKFNSKHLKEVNTGFSYMLPNECREHIEKIWRNDSSFLKAIVPALGQVQTGAPFEIFFMKVIPVTPINTRPYNVLSGSIAEHPQNDIYKAILNNCLVIRSIITIMNNESDSLAQERKELVDHLKGKTYADKLQHVWLELQTNVDSILDVGVQKSSHPIGLGLKQIIEKKEGIIRMNMMGKRVNYAARTVITPDPNLNVDEIGIPEVFAKKLTYPVPVTPWNVQECRALIKNGPDIHPGANFVEMEDGFFLKLDPKDLVQRESVAKRLLTPGEQKGVKILHRHLNNGDILLLNRQPTLHKPSIMAHKARVLHGEKTFRLHYANCKSYNADFDGDEMNAHFPQNEVARSEAYNIVDVSQQYLVPKDGTPLSGLIQDYMVSGVRLTMRGRFFTKEVYMQLVFQALSSLESCIKILRPCIIKPHCLWSGKQVVSTVILNLIPPNKRPLNLLSKSKIDSKAWYKHKRHSWAGGSPFKDSSEMTEAEVIIRGGELLNGVLDKMHYGATQYSLVHCMYELYGGETSTKLLSALAKLFTAFLQIDGFTLGVEDILVTKKADDTRHRIIENARTMGPSIVSEVLECDTKLALKGIENAVKSDPSMKNVLDHQYKIYLDKVTNQINSACLPAGLCVPFPSNNLQLMVQSGAKGSTVNTMQISCLLGQIELEGKRPSLMVSRKSLPSFPPYDSSPRAGGFVDNRLMTGIQPQEFFFHCMAGREGLIDTAVKTSRSGYLQRCLVKHLEGLTVHYDMTVRDSDGSVVQFLYGEDGQEVCKSQFLSSKQLPFLVNNKDAIYDARNMDYLKVGSDFEKVAKYTKKVSHSVKGGGLKKLRESPFTVFSREAFVHKRVKRRSIRYRPFPRT